jgi:hypothetical protein
MPRIIFGLILAIITAASAWAGGSSVTIKQILNSSHYLNSTIVVTGVYKGWGIKGTPPPVTRSDYVIEGDGQQIYVTGPLPVGLSIKDIGKTITIKAKVRSTTLKTAGKKRKITYLEVL